MNWIKHGWSLLGNSMHKITAQFYRYSKRVSELKSVWFLFCSGQVFFERTPGSLLRPVQGTSLREDPWRPPVSIQNFLFKMTSSPRALQIHPTRSYTDSDLFGYTQLKNKIIFLQNDKIIIINYPYLFNYFYFY